MPFDLLILLRIGGSVSLQELKAFVAILPVWYYSPVRQFALVTVTLLFLSACGPKKVQVNAPPLPRVSSSELEGLASYYAEPYHGRRTASGEIFDSYREMTAAHRTLPFNTVVRVTNKTNGREVDVRVNDRGPFVDGRVIDLSLRAAREIDLVRTGTAPVKIKVLKATEVLPTSASPRPVYAVQVGAFENPRAAEELKQRLAGKYPDVTVQILPGEKAVYRVRIGRKPDIQTANRMASQLRKQDFQPFV